MGIEPTSRTATGPEQTVLKDDPYGHYGDPTATPAQSIQ